MLVFAGAPIGLILIIAGFAWIGAILVLVAFVLSFVLWEEMADAFRQGQVSRAAWLQLRRFRLERRLDRLTHELGEAVFDGDPARANAVNQEAHETAAELQAAAAERQRVLLAARARIERHRPSAAGFVGSDGRRRQ